MNKVKEGAGMLQPVTGRPYQVDGISDLWLAHICDPSHTLVHLVTQVADCVAPRLCAAELRVYSEPPNPTHVLCRNSAAAAIALLDRCEVVGVFNSDDVVRDQRIILQKLADAAAPGDDEACLVRALQPRPILFLHAGHEDIDVVCGRKDAEKLLSWLRKNGIRCD